MKPIVVYFNISIVLLLTISCQKRERELPINNTDVDELKEYKELALTKGDTLAYYQLSLDYMDSPYDGFLYPALIMANKYGYHVAYADVYYCLTDHHHKEKGYELENLDNVTRAMALEYLSLGADKGNKECKKILGKLYMDGLFIKQDISKGKQLLEAGEKY